MQVAVGGDFVQAMLDMLALARIGRVVAALDQLVLLMLQRFAMLAMMFPAVVVLSAHTGDRQHGQHTERREDQQAFQHSGLPDDYDLRPLTGSARQPFPSAPKLPAPAACVGRDWLRAGRTAPPRPG